MPEADKFNEPEYMTDLLDLAEEMFGPQAKARAEKADEFRRRRALEDQQMARAIRRTFSSNYGRQTLAWIRQLSVEAEPMTVDQLTAEKPEDRQLLAGVRAGMNEIYLLILLAIKQADESNPKNGDE